MKYKSWHTCEECGDKGYPHATKKWKKKHWRGITIMIGLCPDCGKKKTELVPLDDYKFADHPILWD